MLTRLNSRRGFSLIELAVVLIIIAIIAAIAIPTFLAVINASEDNADEASATAIGRNALALAAASGNTTGSPTDAQFQSAATEGGALASDPNEGTAPEFQATLANGRVVCVTVEGGTQVSATLAAC